MFMKVMLGINFYFVMFEEDIRIVMETILIIFRKVIFERIEQFFYLQKLVKL